VEITITGRRRAIEPAAKEYAEGRMMKILRLHDRLDSAQVVIDQDGGIHVVEGIVNAPQRVFSARGEERELRTAIDQMGHKLESQVRQWKDKLIDYHHGRNGSGDTP